MGLRAFSMYQTPFLAFIPITIGINVIPIGTLWDMYCYGPCVPTKKLRHKDIQLHE